MRGVPAPVPKVLGNNALGRAFVALNQAAIAVSKTLFAYQIFIEAEGTPSPEFLVQQARTSGGLAGFDWDLRRRSGALLS